MAFIICGVNVRANKATSSAGGRPENHDVTIRANGTSEYRHDSVIALPGNSPVIRSDSLTAPTGRSLSHFDPFHTMKTYFPKIHVNIILTLFILQTVPFRHTSLSKFCIPSLLFLPELRVQSIVTSF
jgi:hypothetical protein